MIFNSIVFLFFFLILHFIYWSSKENFRSRILLIGSVIFYGYWSIPFLLHFMGMILLNYLFYYFSNAEYSKRRIALIVALNLINLAFFKYFYFTLNVLEDVFFLKIGTSMTLPTIVLPLAISFYTFQIIAFQVDVHRKRIKERLSFEELLLFIMFFPQLIAGPIMRYDHFFFQLRRKKKYSELSFNAGLILIILGMVKKVVIADSISEVIQPFYVNPGNYNAGSTAMTLYSFAAQIYCDFSGYSDMARGFALLLGYNIPVNFRAPYFSSSFKEFWARWHITLSSWLRDYLYIPLGGNRVSLIRNHTNMFLTMLLGGIWHGANYNFVIWGAMHGGFMVFERVFSLQDKHSNWIINFLKGLVVFHLTMFSLVFFRADNFEKSISILVNLFRTDGMELARSNKLPFLILLTILLHVYEYMPEKFRIPFRYRKIAVPAIGFISAIVIASITSGTSPFIYFQF